jgi:hypothetical protein
MQAQELLSVHEALQQQGAHIAALEAKLVANTMPNKALSARENHYLTLKGLMHA